jgi:hypothetical protein
LRMRIVSGIMLTLLLVGMLTLTFNLYPVSATDLEFPAIYIEPAVTVDEELTPYKNYTISIHTDYNGSDIWGYQFSLTYNPSVLEGVEVVNGDLITEDNVTFIAGTFNNTIGKLGLTGAFSVNKSAPLPYPLVSNTGPGVLANVTFTIVGYGGSSITLRPVTMLVSVDGTHIIDAVNMPDHIGPGYFNNVPSSSVVATQELIETIKTWKLPKGVETSLTSKLDNVIHQVDKGNERGATHKLMLFINQVETLEGKKLTSEQANYLIAEAHRIIDLING